MKKIMDVSIILVVIMVIISVIMFYWVKTDKMVEDYANNPSKYIKNEIRYYIDKK